MRWVQIISLNCVLIHYLVSLWSRNASIYDVPVESKFSGTNFSLGYEVTSVVLQAQYKWQTLGIVIEFFDGAGLNQVSQAFLGSMLASECPVTSVLRLSSIAVRDDVKLANFPEVFGVGCGFERSTNEPKTIRAERFCIQIDDNFSICVDFELSL